MTFDPIDNSETPTTEYVRQRHLPMDINQFDRWLKAERERWFMYGWQSSGEGHNGEYPDEGLPWEESTGKQAYERFAGAHYGNENFKRMLMGKHE